MRALEITLLIFTICVACGAIGFASATILQQHYRPACVVVPLPLPAPVPAPLRAAAHIAT